MLRSDFRQVFSNIGGHISIGHQTRPSLSGAHGQYILSKAKNGKCPYKNGPNFIQYHNRNDVRLKHETYWKGYLLSFLFLLKKEPIKNKKIDDSFLIFNALRNFDSLTLDHHASLFAFSCCSAAAEVVISISKLEEALN